VSATFSEAIAPASVTGTSFVLRDPGGNAVPRRRLGRPTIAMETSLRLTVMKQRSEFGATRRAAPTRARTRHLA
jgi:hypothetical protein